MSAQDKPRADAMSVELEDIFGRLHDECSWLHLRWQEYVLIFGTSEKRLELVNRAAGGFFYYVQDSMWESMLLHLCRMTDPTNHGRGRENLTINRLPELVHANICEDLRTLLVTAKEKTEFARDWRNRRFAHRDLALVRKSAVPLAEASRSKVREALAAIGACLNLVHLEYKETTTVWEPIGPLNGATALLYVLRDGLNAEEARRERIANGIYLDEDIGPEEPFD